METLFFEGFLLQASLIFALGAQNLFVIESGLKKQNPVLISLVCFFCDLTLIMIGVSSAGYLVSTFLELKIIIGLLSSLFLLYYGLKKIFGPMSESPMTNVDEMKKSLWQSLVLAITFSWLNPHAYLDAFILIGGYASKYHQLSDRLTLGWGAACFSLVWFLTLISASHFFRPLLSRSKSMKMISVLSGSLLVFLSLRMGQDLYAWMQASPYPKMYAELLKTI